MTPLPRRTSLALAITAVFAIAACAPYAQDKRVAAPQSPPLPAATATAAPGSATVAAAAASAAAAVPMVADGGLKIIDRQVGTGKEAQSGKAAMVHYTGWLYDEKAPDNKGKQFDSSATRGLPFGFIVGVGRVIKGWDQGVAGMKVGGKRTLIIPAALAYGDKEVGNGLIPTNSTLLFDIELIEVKP